MYSMRSVDWHQDTTLRVKECRDITPGLQKRDARHAHDVRRGPPVGAPSSCALLWWGEVVGEVGLFDFEAEPPLAVNSKRP